MKMFLFLISFSLFANDCPMEFKETKYCGDVTWIDGPYLDKLSHFQFKTWIKEDESSTTVSPDYNVKIYSWMIMHGGHNHGGPKMNPKEILPGVFDVLDAKFYMGGMEGFWEIRVDLKNNTQVISTASKRVKFE